MEDKHDIHKRIYNRISLFNKKYENKLALFNQKHTKHKMKKNKTHSKTEINNSISRRFHHGFSFREKDQDNHKIKKKLDYPPILQPKADSFKSDSE